MTDLTKCSDEDCTAGSVFVLFPEDGGDPIAFACREHLGWLVPEHSDKEHPILSERYDLAYAYEYLKSKYPIEVPQHQQSPKEVSSS